MTDPVAIRDESDPYFGLYTAPVAKAPWRPTTLLGLVAIREQQKRGWRRPSNSKRPPALQRGGPEFYISRHLGFAPDIL